VEFFGKTVCLSGLETHFPAVPGLNWGFISVMPAQAGIHGF
jgi:hypothetical protein